MKILILTLLLVLSLCAMAASPGDEVVVVYNSRVPDSKTVADHYAQARHVPADQVFGFEMSTNEDMTRAEFRQTLQEPLAAALQKHGLWHVVSRTVPATNNQPAREERSVADARVRYAVLCYGVPLRILHDPQLREEGMEKLRPEMRRNEAAVDSELSLLPLMEQKLPLTGALRNLAYATTNAAWMYPTNGLLLVARLDGPTAAVARGLVDKAIEAETNGLWGRAYFDLRNTTEPGYKLGDDWIRNAGEMCRHLGFETVVDESPNTFPAGFPMSQIAIYIGWYDQNISGPLAQPEVEFMPGAFAYHLHSYSAVTLRSDSRGWVGPLIARGATISMGCVQEPFLTGTPDVAVFTSRLLYFGFTFGEAACASQPVLSWQTTVVGDPLYRPTGKNPDQLQNELRERQSPWLEWSYLRLVNLNLLNGKTAECAGILEQLDLTKTSAVLREKLGDLYATQGKPSSAIQEWQEALKLDCSPQQKVRLLLTLGEKLTVLGREAEAYAAYQELLAEHPEYPDKVRLFRILLPMAQKLNKTNDIARYEAALRPQGQGK
jgi:uncharacterized protein (TIGR03790 family)